MSRRVQRFLVFGGPLILCFVLIFISGGEIARYERSWWMIQTALRVLCPEHAPSVDKAGVQIAISMYQMNGALRRLAHMVAYSVLSILTVRAIQSGNPRLKPAALSAALLLAVLFTGLDELHRMFEAHRHAKWEDIILNLTGSVLTIGGILGYFGIKSVEQKVVSPATSQDPHLSQAS